MQLALRGKLKPLLRELRIAKKAGCTTPRGLVGSSRVVMAAAGGGINCPKLSSPNPIINRQLRHEYEEVLAGRGTPRPGNGPGGLDLYKADGLSPAERAKWKDSVIYDVPGTNHRVLKRPDGLIGFIWKHDYKKPRLFPAPWYKDGGAVPKLKP